MQRNFPVEVIIMPKLSSISRRRFAQLVGVGAVSAVARPSIAWPDEVMARSTVAARAAASAIVRLNSNENPYGPSPLALKAMTDAFSLAWRYPDEHADALVEQLAKVNGVSRDQIVLGDGSGEILKMCAAAFTGPMSSDNRAVSLSKPTRGSALTFTPGRGKLIVADPTFEPILNHALVSRAEVVKVSLTSSFSHD